jgi:hypothetical protein
MDQLSPVPESGPDFQFLIGIFIRQNSGRQMRNIEIAGALDEYLKHSTWALFLTFACLKKE